MNQNKTGKSKVQGFKKGKLLKFRLQTLLFTVRGSFRPKAISQLSVEPLH